MQRNLTYSRTNIGHVFLPEQLTVTPRRYTLFFMVALEITHWIVRASSLTRFRVSHWFNSLRSLCRESILWHLRVWDKMSPKGHHNSIIRSAYYFFAVTKRSFMWIRKKKGDETEPWGIPMFPSKLLKLIQSKDTWMIHLMKNSINSNKHLKNQIRDGLRHISVSQRRIHMGGVRGRCASLLRGPLR